jgi:hypothetical protein
MAHTSPTVQERSAAIRLRQMIESQQLAITHISATASKRDLERKGDLQGLVELARKVSVVLRTNGWPMMQGYLLGLMENGDPQLAGWSRTIWSDVSLALLSGIRGEVIEESEAS